MSAVRAAFETERAWLRRCGDQRAVLDRMASYRDDLATARRVGNAEAYRLVEHLIELAEDRLTELKAEALRPRHPVVAPSAPSPTPPRARPSSDDRETVRRLREQLAASEEAKRRAVEDREIAERRARAAEQREAMRAPRDEPTIALSGEILPSPALTLPPPTANATRLDPPPTTTSARPSPTINRTPPRPTASPTRPPAPAPAVARPLRPSAEPARTAPTVARPATLPAPGITSARPAPAPTGGTATPAPAPATPAPSSARTFTGADLAAFRRDAGLTQVAAAQRLGVTQGTISKAEGNPRAALGPALQDALRRAIG